MKNKINALFAAISAFVLILAAIGCCYVLDRAIACFFPGFTKWFWFVVIIYMLYRDFIGVFKQKKEAVDWDKVFIYIAGQIMAGTADKYGKLNIPELRDRVGESIRTAAITTDYVRSVIEERERSYGKEV